MNAYKFRIYDNEEKKYLDESSAHYGFYLTMHGEVYNTKSDIYDIRKRYTVQLYTMWNDKNNRRICEGDLLRYFTSESRLGLIKFQYGAFVLVDIITKDKIPLGVDFPYPNHEVIGDIFRTPEYLKTYYKNNKEFMNKTFGMLK